MLHVIAVRNQWWSQAETFYCISLLCSCWYAACLYALNATCPRYIVILFFFMVHIIPILRVAHVEFINASDADLYMACRGFQERTKASDYLANVQDRDFDYPTYSAIKYHQLRLIFYLHLRKIKAFQKGKYVSENSLSKALLAWYRNANYIATILQNIKTYAKWNILIIWIVLVEMIN